MTVREALPSDLQEVMAFYDFMCRELASASFMHKGNQGGFPSLDMVSAAIEKRQLYIGEAAGEIMAAYILNHEADPMYDRAVWKIDVPKEAVSVLHALRVHPAYSGKGYASYLLKHAIQTATEKAQRAIRLDCLEENLIPRKMYLSHGFEYIDTVEIYYKDIGEPRRCMLFEKLL